MRKNILSLSIATMIGGLGFAGAASAAVVNAAAVAAPAGNVVETLAAGSIADTLAINAKGTGHILLVPYFSAQGDNVTLLNLVNTDTKNGKAVKLRFRGAANSDDLYDITILLSPGDVWTGSVSRDGTTGAARMTTTDNTCTRPAKADVNTTFATTRLGSVATTADTLEGYVEILNVADIPFNAANASSTTASTLYAAIKHNSSNVATCTEATLATLDAEIVAATQAALGTAMVNKGLSFPTGGLFANWTIVDWAKKGTYTGEATALEAQKAGATAAANMVLFPQKSTPVLDQYASTTAIPVVAATVDGYTADPVLRGATPNVSPRNYDLPDLSTPYVTAIGAASPAYTAAGVATPITNANALSTSLATTSVVNEFVTSPVSATNTIPFSTDWVFSMPSRRYAVAIAYGTTVGTNAAVFNAAAASKYFTAANSALNTAKTRVCVTPGPVTDEITFFNREENTSSAGAVVSPQVTANVQFCGETSVLTFNDTTSLLGAKIATQQITTGVVGNMHYEGWASIPTRGLIGATATMPTSTTQGYRGLPILGSAFVKGVSASAGNLGGTWTHRSTVANITD